MKSKVLVIYQFATFGGVERVLLNRAEAFKYYKKNFKLYVYFYSDCGAKKSLKDTIKKNGLNDYIEIIDNFNIKDYDYIVAIDTPQFLNDCNVDLSKVYIETHTFEKKYRKYLDEYYNKVKKIIVPSEIFKNQLIKEYGNEFSSKINVVNNFVPWDIEKNNNEKVILPDWSKKILFYFGRMDNNKNVKEIADSFKKYLKNYSDDMLLILIGVDDPEYNVKKYVKDCKIDNKVIFLPPINFNKVDVLLNSLQEKKAIFVSSSKGETFGLSAAETLSFNIPTILSDIEAHKKLVNNNKQLIYSLGNTDELAKKIYDTSKNYDIIVDDIGCYKLDFSAKKFIRDWNELFSDKDK